MHKLDKIAERLEKTLHSPGYEASLDIAWGYIKALHHHGIITTKQKNALVKVYASIENDNCDFYIENGNLCKHTD